MGQHEQLRTVSTASWSSASGLAPTIWAERKPNASDLRQIFAEVQRAGGDDDALPHPLEDITDLELEEIRQLKHPPATVRRVMECVQLILFESEVPGATGLPWSTCVRSIVKTDFLRKVRRYEIDQLAEKPMLVDHICCEYFAPSPASGLEPLRPERVKRASVAVVAFFGWTVALIAGVLPDWPEEIGGEEARQVIFAIEAERQKQVRKEVERKAEIARREAAAEAAKQEAARLEEERREAERRERERLEEEERERAIQEEAARAEEARAEELRREQERRRAEAAAREDAEMMLRARREEEEAQYMEWCIWGYDDNPERRFLQVDGASVSFPSDDKANFCNVVTEEPVLSGRVYFEFLLHHVGDEQWCGVTVDPAQAGSRVSGRNLLRSWTYYCGRRWGDSRAFKDEGIPCLQVGKRSVQKFARVSSGDTIGMLLDADRRAVCFLRNGELQGACVLDGAGRQPLYALTHLDAAGDAVELRASPAELAPRAARDALSAVLGAPASYEVVD